jgi:hypothetical protein
VENLRYIHRNPGKAWIGGAPGGLVCVERTLLSTAFDSSPEKREWSRSNRTGQQPNARTREFIPPFGDATQPKSPAALRFAMGRATPLLFVVDTFAFQE